MKKEIIVFKDPKSPISETFRTLRTNIQFMNTKGKLKTLLVTSTFPGEGKSWISANLAVTFAQAGKKVILLDADMRKGRQYTIFGVSPRPGLSNYLSGVGINEDETLELEDYIQNTEVENLYLMPAGNIPPNPSELLIAPEMVDLLERLKDMCDIVVIDGTPSQLVTDSIILSRLVDSTIIVASSKETKKEDLRRIINNINQVGGKIAGIIVNKVTLSAKKYEQSYYYGSTSAEGLKNRAMNVMGERKTKKSNFLDGKGNFEKRANYENKIDSEKKEMNRIEALEKDNKDELKNNNKVFFENKNDDGTSEISIDRTKDILNQINQYIENEKKKMK